MRTSSLADRAGLIAAAAAAVLVAVSTPASAHVEVSADKLQAGATDVTVTFVAESESNSAGIVSLRVVLPAGIAPADVTYVSGPTGWKLTPAADGYTVAGPAVPAGRDATYKVKIAQLSVGATSLPFKTVQTYSNGKIDRWIEIPTPGQAEPATPAPVLKVTAAATPTAPAATSAAPTAATTTTPAAPTTAAAQPRSSEASSPWWWIVAGIAVLVVLAAGGLWWVRRRRTGGTGG